jgi:hypothetical protein
MSILLAVTILKFGFFKHPYSTNDQIFTPILGQNTQHVIILNRFCFQERILLEPMYEAPGSGVSAILIDGEVIRDGKQPVLFSGDERVDVCTMKLRY